MIKIGLSSKVEEKPGSAQDLVREDFVVLSGHNMAAVCKSSQEAVDGCVGKAGLETPILSCKQLQDNPNGPQQV